MGLILIVGQDKIKKICIFIKAYKRFAIRDAADISLA